jgi:hypothetical protein
MLPVAAKSTCSTRVDCEMHGTAVESTRMASKCTKHYNHVTDIRATMHEMFQVWE